MKTIYFILFHIFLSSFSLLGLNSIAQIPVIKWQQCYGTENNDYIYCIEQSNNGYVVGLRVNDGTGLTNYHGSSEIWIINVDNNGFLVWEKCFGGSSGEEPQKLLRHSENNFFLYGYTFSNDGDVQSLNNGGGDLWLAKINYNSEIIWEKCYGSPGPDEPRDFILTPDGGGLMLSRIHASGGDVSLYYGSWDVWLCKIDSIGNIEWEKTLGNQYLDNAVTLQINSQGNIYVLAASVFSEGMVSCGLNNIDNYDIWLVELNMEGEILNQYCFGGSYNDIGFVFEELEDGLIFAGITNSNDFDVSGYHGTPGALGYADIWVVRLDENMNILWQKCLGGSEIEYPEHITQTEDGNFILVGETSSHNYDVTGNHSIPNGYDSDVWVVKLSSDGEILWQKCYGGWGDERLYVPHTVHQKSDYNFVLASWTDYVSDDVTCDIHQTYIQDAWIFEIDLEDTTNTVEYDKSNAGLKVYPNPAKDYIIIEPGAAHHAPPAVKAGQALKGGEQAYVVIMDIFGREVARKSIISEKTVFDLRQWYEGIYFFRVYPVSSGVASEAGMYSGKIVIQR